MPLSDHLCKFYQSLFAGDHPEEAALGRLHAEGRSTSDLGLFLRAYFDHEYRKGQEVVALFSELTKEWEGGRALDFGAGGGGLTFQIRSRCREAVGLDVDDTKLAFARAEVERRGVDGIEFVHYDGGTPVPLADGSFDCIFCVDVVEHLPAPEVFFGEFCRLLRPGGLVLLTFGPPWRHPHGKHMWTKLPGWWTHLLFSRATVMRVLGYHEDTTYESLGLHRLTVARYEASIRKSHLQEVCRSVSIMKPLRPLASIPVVREFFISGVTGVYRRPT